jgi:hypothetical protein
MSINASIYSLLIFVLLSSLSAYGKSYEISWMPQAKSTLSDSSLIILENQLVLDNDTFPNLVAMFPISTGKLYFTVNNTKIIPKPLGTPILTDDSLLLPTIFVNSKQGQFFCMEKAFNESHRYLKYFHNNYLIYKINNIWESVYFYSSLSCQQSVGYSGNKLHIKYDILNAKHGGSIIKLLRVVRADGQIRDVVLAKKMIQ